MTEKKEEPGGAAVADEPKPALMGIREIAYEIGVATDTARDMVRRFDIPLQPLRIGNSIRFRRDVFEAWIKADCPRAGYEWDRVLKEAGLPPFVIKAGR